MMDSTTWFCAAFGEIEPVLVVRQTGASLVIRRRRTRINALDNEMRVTASEEILVEERARISSRLGHYFRTWEEAHAHLLKEADARLERARRDLQLAQSAYGHVKGMKPPAAEIGRSQHG